MAAQADKLLSELSDTELRVGLGVENDSKWRLGGGVNATFGFEAATESALIIRTQGELMRYRLGQDDEQVEVVKIPEGDACV